MSCQRLVFGWLVALVVCGIVAASSSLPREANLGEKQQQHGAMNLRGGEKNGKVGLGVKLDVSGHYDCLVVGSPKEGGVDRDDSGLVPLCRWKRPSMPSITIGTDYSLQKAWYGATRLTSKFRWSWATAGKRWIPAWTECGVDQGVCEEERDTAAHIATGWKTPSSSSSSCFVSLRCNNQGTARVLASLPLHNRFGLTYQHTLSPRGDESTKYASDDYFARRLPEPGRDRDWWLPDFRADPTGRVTSYNEIGWRDQWGLRISFGRNLGWMNTDDDNDETTSVSLQLVGLHPSRQACTVFQANAALERIRQTASCTVSHERCSFPKRKK